MYAMIGEKKFAKVPLVVDGVITPYQAERMIHSSIFFSQMILLHTDESTSLELEENVNLPCITVITITTFPQINPC